MSEMVERVARALAGDAGSVACYRDDARAAMEAMRTPTLRMVETGAVKAFADTPTPGMMWTQIPLKERAESLWTAMLDAALSE